MLKNLILVSILVISVSAFGAEIDKNLLECADAVHPLAKGAETYDADALSKDKAFNEQKRIKLLASLQKDLEGDEFGIRAIERMTQASPKPSSLIWVASRLESNRASSEYDKARAKQDETESQKKAAFEKAESEYNESLKQLRANHQKANNANARSELENQILKNDQDKFDVADKKMKQARKELDLAREEGARLFNKMAIRSQKYERLVKTHHAKDKAENGTDFFYEQIGEMFEICNDVPALSKVTARGLAKLAELDKSLVAEVEAEMKKLPNTLSPIDASVRGVSDVKEKTNAPITDSPAATQDARSEGAKAGFAR